MAKQKIRAREAVDDVTSGMSDADLMKKYSLSEKGLESLFQKLVEAGLLEASLISKRSAKPTKDRGAKPIETTDAKPQDPPDLLAAVAEDMKGGLHDAEIMRRHEISPGKLNEMKARLLESGFAAGANIAGNEAPKTKACPFCSREIQESQTNCPHCGQWLGTGDRLGNQGASPALTGSRPEIPRSDKRSDDDDFEEDKDCPWEDRESYGTLNAYFQTATKCLLTPSTFFSKLPLRDGYLNPILFAAMTGVVSFLLVYLFVSLFSRGGIGFLGLIFGSAFVFLGSLIVIPIGLALWSGILHTVLYLLGGTSEGYQATFRVVSYSSVTGLFNAIPVVGNLASLWGLVLTVIGLRETHKTSTGKSVAAVLIPIGVVVGFAIAIAVIAGFTLASKMSKAVGEASVAGPVASTDYSDWKLPSQVCAALDDYVNRVASAKNLDSQSAQATIQEAINELNGVLNQFENQAHIAEVRAKASSYGLAEIAKGQFKQQFGGTMDGLMQQGGDMLTEDLKRMCGK